MTVPNRRGVPIQQIQQAIAIFLAFVVIPDQCLRGLVISVNGRVGGGGLHLVVNSEGTLWV